LGEYWQHRYGKQKLRRLAGRAADTVGRLGAMETATEAEGEVAKAVTAEAMETVTGVSVAVAMVETAPAEERVMEVAATGEEVVETVRGGE